MSVSVVGYAQMLVELASYRPTVICHPEDADKVREAVAATDLTANIEVTELALPGQITIFKGSRWAVSDLGSI